MGGGAAFSFSKSNPVTKSPFGNLPFGLAGGYRGGFAQPLMEGLGIGTGKGARNFFEPGGQYDQSLAQGSPLAQYIQGVRGMAGNIIPQATEVGNEIASRAPGLYNQLQGQVTNYLSNLGTYTNSADQGVGRANQLVQQAFSPIQNQSLYQYELGNANKSALATAGGRGLLDAGGTQALEDQNARALAASYGGQLNDQRLQALGAQSQLAQAAAALRGTGIGAANAGMSGLDFLHNALSARYLDPMNAAGGLFSMLTGATNPQLQLLQLTEPTVANASHSFSQSAQAGVGGGGGGGM